MISTSALEDSRRWSAASCSTFTRQIADWRRAGKPVSWERVKTALSQAFGFWSHLSLTAEQEARLKRVYEETLLNPSDTLVQSLYEANEPMTETAKQIINEIARIAWTCGSHTAGYVPLYAIGAGAEKFGGTIDNTDIPRIVSEIFGYK